MEEALQHQRNRRVQRFNTMVMALVAIIVALIARWECKSQIDKKCQNTRAEAKHLAERLRQCLINSSGVRERTNISYWREQCEAIVAFDCDSIIVKRSDIQDWLNEATKQLELCGK